MDTQILVIYCITDDFLKAMPHYQDPQQKMTDAEIITTALVAMLYFGGNFDHARRLLSAPHFVPQMLSRSRFNRRLHRLHYPLQQLFLLLAQHFQRANSQGYYVIDSFPVAVCDNIRIRRCKIYQEEAYRGYTASKKRYFYGLKIHLCVTASGQPVEFFLTPGSVADVQALDDFALAVAANSTLYADKAYNDYDFEDRLKDQSEIDLQPLRKQNAKRQFSGCVHYLQQKRRKIVETSGSLINRLLPKSIHAVTARGFELKVALFVIAFAFNCAF